MRKIIFSIVFGVFLLAGCGGKASESGLDFEMMGPGSGMSARHHAVVPEEYANLQSPELSDSDIVVGGELYSKMCAACHGDGGMGDGPTAASLDPAPSPVAHTSTMLSDGYLYWRVAEGGAEFKSTMPAWKNSLNEDDIWALIGYMRALGSGDLTPGSNMGGETYDPEFEAAFHEQMLAQAVEQGLISEDESATFLLVHAALDEFRALHADELPQGSMDENQEYMLNELVKAGAITQAQADDFARIHQLLLDEGLMQ